MNQQRHRGGRRDFGRESKQDAFGSQDCLHFEQIGNYEHKGEVVIFHTLHDVRGGFKQHPLSPRPSHIS